jgi:hypothetical protein
VLEDKYTFRFLKFPANSKTLLFVFLGLPLFRETTVKKQQRKEKHAKFFIDIYEIFVYKTKNIEGMFYSMQFKVKTYLIWCYIEYFCKKTLSKMSSGKKQLVKKDILWSPSPSEKHTGSFFQPRWH